MQDKKEEETILIFQTTNICPVTGWPYEIPLVRRTIIRTIEEALREKMAVVLLFWDLDNLKGMNDALGKKRVNKAIKAVGEDKKEKLARIRGIRKIFSWRPQAGGDEFNHLLLVRRADLAKTERRIQQIIHSSFLFQGWPVTASLGIARVKQKDNKTGGKILQQLEKQAERELNREKMEKAILAYRALKRKMDKEKEIEKIVEILTEEYGPRRPGKSIMRMVLEYLWQRVENEK